MAAADWVLQQVIVDVQYKRGMTYLDKCGSLLLSLEDTLGKPFEGTIVPTVDHGELRSAAERILVTYGPRNFNVTQSWVKSPARVEHIAPIGWHEVAEKLDVARTVSRCGVRFMLLYKVETLGEGQERLAKGQFAPQPDLWYKLVGESPLRAWSAVAEDARGKQRVSLDTVEIGIEGSLPEELTVLVPRFAIFLDFDSTYPGSDSITLNKADLKEFIRSSWQRARAVAKVVGQQLGFPP